MERFLQVTRDHPVGGVPADYASIVGAPRCSAGRTRCDLSRGIETDAQARTITVHLTRRDPDFLHKLTMPWAFVVPAGSPRAPLRAAAARHRALPRRRLGPDRGGALVRNPHFGSAARARAPTASRTGSTSTSAARAGRPRPRSPRSSAEPPTWPSSRTRSSASSKRIASGAAGAHPGAGPQRSGPDLDWMFLNVRSRPFDDHPRAPGGQLRDRPRPRGRPHRGPETGRPRCQIVPIGFPATSRTAPTPRTRRRAAAGPRPTWSEHALVAASGRRRACRRLEPRLCEQHRPVLHGAAQRARLPRQAARVEGSWAPPALRAQHPGADRRLPVGTDYIAPTTAIQTPFTCAPADHTRTTSRSSATASSSAGSSARSPRRPRTPRAPGPPPITVSATSRRRSR